MLYNKSGNSAIQAFAIISLACRTFQWNSFILQVKKNNALSWNSAYWNEKKNTKKNNFSEFTFYEVTCKCNITEKIVRMQLLQRLKSLYLQYIYVKNGEMKHSKNK